MVEIPSDLQVNKLTVTLLANKFAIVENYISIVEYDTAVIRVKGKGCSVKIIGDKLSLKYMDESEIGIKGIIKSVEYTD